MDISKVSRNDIVKQVSIVDIASMFSIGLERVSAGNFQWKCKCPSSEHKHGMEKTSSLYINEKDNNFFCYGCNAGTSVIDFYMMCSNLDFSNSFNELKKLVKQPGKYKSNSQSQRDNLPFLLENSELIRKYLTEDPSRIHSMDSFLRNLDDQIFDLHKDEVVFVQGLNKKLEHKFGLKK